MLRQTFRLQQTSDSKRIKFAPTTSLATRILEHSLCSTQITSPAEAASQSTGSNQAEGERPMRALSIRQPYVQSSGRRIDGVCSIVKGIHPLIKIFDASEDRLTQLLKRADLAVGSR